MTDLAELLERVKAETGYNNALDVAIEIALFKPDARTRAIRANEAGTKVIYTDRAGNDKTHWARDWTISPGERNRTAKLLSALIAQAKP